MTYSKSLLRRAVQLVAQVCVGLARSCAHLLRRYLDGPGVASQAGHLDVLRPQHALCGPLLGTQPTENQRVCPPTRVEGFNILVIDLPSSVCSPIVLASIPTTRPRRKLAMRQQRMHKNKSASAAAQRLLVELFDQKVSPPPCGPPLFPLSLVLSIVPS